MRVFLKPHRRWLAPPGAQVRLADVADVAADERTLADRLRGLAVGRAPAAGRFGVLRLVDLVGSVAAAAPQAEVHVLGGGEDVVLQGRHAPGGLQLLLTAAAWLLLFVGGTVAMLNFHADVNMPAAHRELYRLLTGRGAARPLVLEIPYALGVGAGVLLFFRPRGGGEPSPLELESDRYEQTVHAYLRERR